MTTGDTHVDEKPVAQEIRRQNCVTSVVLLSHQTSLGTTISRLLDKWDNRYLQCSSHHWLFFCYLQTYAPWCSVLVWAQARKWWSWKSNPGPSDSKAILLAVTHPPFQYPYGATWRAYFVVCDGYVLPSFPWSPLLTSSSTVFAVS